MVKLEKDELIVKLDKDNKLNDICKIQFASQVNNIKSLNEGLVKCKAKMEIVTSAKFDKGPNSKEIKLYIPLFKRNHKLNIRIMQLG